MQLLISGLSIALDAYRKAVSEVNDAEAASDYSRLLAIAEDGVAELQAGDIAQAKLSLLGFSRQASDSYAVQPPEFKLLAEKVAEAKRLLT